MGIGVISISTNAKKEQSGPPFAAGSANNGLSVDTVTGKIVLGNDLGDATAPAQLISNREIQLEDSAGNPFTITLTALTALVKTILSGSRVEVLGDPFTSSEIFATTGDGGTSQIQALAGIGGVSAVVSRSGNGGIGTITVNSDNTDIFTIQVDGSGVIQCIVSNTFNVWQINIANLGTQIANGSPVAFNNACLQVSGNVTKRLFTQSQGAGTYNINRDLDSGKSFRNTGALVLALPNMVGANDRPGFYFDVVVTNAAGITVDADAGVSIRFGGLVSSAGGTVTSTDVSACLRVLLIDGSTWAVTSYIGSWSLT